MSHSWPREVYSRSAKGKLLMGVSADLDPVVLYLLCRGCATLPGLGDRVDRAIFTVPGTAERN